MRELLILRRNHIYRFCMVVFPILVMVFFTSMMDDGLPTSMPVGVVDLDNTSTTRALTRRLDGFQMSHVVAHYPSMTDARKAIQQNEIYAFLYIPKGTTDKLLASRQPKVSFYYSMTSLAAGSLLFKDLKTITTLGSAAVGQATLQARGFTDAQIQTLLQPIRIDLHQMTRDEAWSALESFVTSCVRRGLRKVLIIHGKGEHSHGSDPVLGPMVKSFIEQDQRLGLSGHPDRNHGGNGATWVIVRQ